MEDHTEKRPQHSCWDHMYTGQASDYFPPDPKILSFLENFDAGKALDVGWGAAGLCIALAKCGWTVTGIDIAPKSNFFRSSSRAHTHEVEVAFVLDDASTWRPDDTYDLITCNFLRVRRVCETGAKFPRRKRSKAAVIYYKASDIVSQLNR